MSEGNQAGFQTQGDVVSLASLGHLITGRILKALSDGGVDLYAVAASVWLGKHLRVRTSLESTVHAHLSAKKGVNGFLAKALSIGWGHSHVAVEMSKTKAGTNALLLIGAFASGTTSYVAAQCFSELFSLFECEPDKSPSLDVLKAMIAYLAPLVQDLGFAKVLEHITTSAIHMARQKFLCFFTDSFDLLGDASVLAGAVKQLMLTSEKGETIYLVPRQRAAWLATFASHILGMAVEITYDETLLWASGGSSGKAIFQVNQFQETTTSVQHHHRTSDVILLDAPSTEEGKEVINIDYGISDALSAELGHLTLLDNDLRMAVHRAIARLSGALLYVIRMGPGGDPNFEYPILGGFHTTPALLQTLKDLGIHTDALSFAASRYIDMRVWTLDRAADNGLAYLNEAEAQSLKSRCYVHRGKDMEKQDDCICCLVGRLIHGFAASAVALMQCRYDVSQIRLAASVLKSQQHSTWSSRCIMEDQDLRGVPIALDHHELFLHLAPLVFGHFHPITVERAQIYARSWKKGDVVGLSAGSSTIFFSCILDQDCFDPFGRVITIAPGRASMNGALRHIITDQGFDPLWFYYDVNTFGTVSTMANGNVVEPHYYPSHLQTFMSARLTEHEIIIRTAVGQDMVGSTELPLSLAISSFFFSIHAKKPCGHPLNDPHKIEPVMGLDFSILPFNPLARQVHDEHLLCPLKGRKLEQILQCLIKPRGYASLQLWTCLACTIKGITDQRRRNPNGEVSKSFMVIMGG